MKTYNEYLGMSAEQLLADPEAPESLKIAARIEMEKAEAGQAEYKPAEAYALERGGYGGNRG